MISKQILSDCPCGDHERWRACCAQPCSEGTTPAARAGLYVDARFQLVVEYACAHLKSVLGTHMQPRGYPRVQIDVQHYKALSPEQIERLSSAAGLYVVVDEPVNVAIRRLTMQVGGLAPFKPSSSWSVPPPEVPEAAQPRPSPEEVRRLAKPPRDERLAVIADVRAEVRARAKGREEDALVHHLLREPLTPAGVKAAFAPLMERARGKGTFPLSRRDSDAMRYLDNARRAALNRAALIAEYAAQKARADWHHPERGDDPDDLWRRVEVATRVMWDQLLLAQLVEEP